MGRGDDPPRLSGLMFHRNTSGGQERSFGEVSGGTEYPMKRPVGARPLSEGVSSGSGSGAGVIGGSFRSPPGPQVVVCDSTAVLLYYIAMRYLQATLCGHKATCIPLICLGEV